MTTKRIAELLEKKMDLGLATALDEVEDKIGCLIS